MYTVKGAILMILCLAALSVQAQYPYVQPGHYRAPEQMVDPTVVLQRGLNKLLDFAARAQRADAQETMLFLEKEIGPYFDFDYMAQWVGGGRWQYMNPGQRQAMSAELQQMFLTTLAQKLSAYGGQGFKVLRARGGRGSEVIVPVAVLNPSGYPARLNFRFYRSEAGGWKVFDVSANGSSALVYYRQHFNKSGYPAGQRGMGFRR